MHMHVSPYQGIYYWYKPKYLDYKINPSPNDKTLGLSELKVFAGDKIIGDLKKKKYFFFCKENIVEKE